MKYITQAFVMSAFLTSLILSGCSESKQQVSVRQAAFIESDDECHLCGMLISNFPGPKGESYIKTSDVVKKFCSTRDLFSFILDPEFQHQVKEIYVHDMSQVPWGSPDDAHFIDARHAWYVAGSNQTGAMGRTLASFKQQSDAIAFSTEFGGKVYRFEDIKLTLL
ncbi:nitrous oxide reductase accessory protein NosL [Shewanella sp. UCD-KL12]|uniref:nitrous oxide reductase accessory protein NosL n=1 Tax=Shewanella sp. UCD-KL12 TaxID=1917163 RepID=UPI000970ECFC|nr:nitrous oxide reductase accessory protein NosL [Shewanella sp. UCD-KL12]